MTRSLTEAAIHMWLVEPMPAGVAQSIERLRHAEDVRHVAVMPDVHLANEVCVGVALATERLIYPAAVGSDVGCGMAAIRFESGAELLESERSAARLLAGLYRLIPSIKHSRDTMASLLPGGLEADTLSDPRLEKLKARDGRFQFATLGRGNHFIEVQADEQNRLWLMIHSGSRGMGQAITAHHLKRATEKGPHETLVRFDAESPVGQAYLSDAAWAVRYAEQNRLAMVNRVELLFAELFQVEVARDSLIHSNHNHVRSEVHFGQTYWVHRKGALSAATDEPGVIPGSMGTASFHVRGRGQTESLCSSSHGAGRSLRRGDAMKQIGERQLLREMQGIWFDQRQLARLRDEAPSAYKEIGTVVRAQRELTKIERQLRPLLSYKGV